MSTDPMPLAEALEVVERYGRLLEETQLFGRIGRAQVTLCAAVRRYEAALRQIDGYSLIPEDSQIRPAAMSYVKPSEFAWLVRGIVTAALAAEGGDDGTAE